MDPLLSVHWLAEHIQDPNIAVLDATLPPVAVIPVEDVHGRYLAQHIPGALWFDIEAISDHNTNLPHMMPSPDDFARHMSELGVAHSMRIVVYEQQGVFSAPRAWWMLRTMGVKAVQVLDGGLKAWLDAGLPTEAGVAKRPHANFRAELDTDVVRSLADVQRIVNEPAEQRKEQLLDARSAGRFAGTAPEPRPGLKSGHMPGAVSLPYTELVHGNRLRAKDELLETFSRAGIDLNRPVTTTCGSGVTAAVLALALEHCGTRQVRLYDGSWAEYAQQQGVAIVTK